MSPEVQATVGAIRAYGQRGSSGLSPVERTMARAMLRYMLASIAEHATAAHELAGAIRRDLPELAEDDEATWDMLIECGIIR